MTQKKTRLTLKRSTQFKRDLKKAIRQRKNLDLLAAVVNQLQGRQNLPEKYQDHALGGNWNGYRECHLEADWLLICKVAKEELLLNLLRLGSHSALFKK